MPARSVVVVMPFGGKDEVERRRAILNFKRLEYLIRTKCQVEAAMPGGGSERISYAVEVARTAMDNIPERALHQIDTADVLIALVTEHNPNVIYEVAYRRARDRTVVLVVDSAEDLPLYVKSLAYQSWKQEAVLRRIDVIARDQERVLPDFSVGIPDDLKSVIDSQDGVLKEGLEEALAEVEKTFKPRVSEDLQYLLGIVSEKTVTLYPNSVVEVAFADRHTFDTSRAPAVVDFDNAFSQLYGYANKQAMENDRPLTLGKLVDRLKRFVDPKDLDEFVKEQGEHAEVMREHEFARSKVPLRINDKHRWREYRGTSYLPCVVAQVFDGDQDGPHTMYLLIVYIALPETLAVVAPPAGAGA